jgi:hypothetical protein
VNSNIRRAAARRERGSRCIFRGSAARAVSAVARRAGAARRDIFA